MLKTLFPNLKPIIGVIHAGALPGTPMNKQTVAELKELAVREAQIYRDGGVDGIMVENMHDTPYKRGQVGPEIVAAMAVIGHAVKIETDLPVGVQVLAAANTEAMAVAHAAGLDFIRVESYAFAHVADEGLIEASAAELLRYRRMISAEGVQVWADIKKKHASHAITADVTLGEMAAAVEFMRADACIVTGAVTGQAPRADDAQEAKAHSSLPVLLGSGINAANIGEFYAIADGFIVGSSFKADGHWSNSVDLRRVEGLMAEMRKLRER